MRRKLFLDINEGITLDTGVAYRTNFAGSSVDGKTHSMTHQYNSGGQVLTRRLVTGEEYTFNKETPSEMPVATPGAAFIEETVATPSMGFEQQSLYQAGSKDKRLVFNFRNGVAQVPQISLSTDNFGRPRVSQALGEDVMYGIPGGPHMPIMPGLDWVNDVANNMLFEVQQDSDGSQFMTAVGKDHVRMEIGSSDMNSRYVASGVDSSLVFSSDTPSVGGDVSGKFTRTWTQQTNDNGVEIAYDKYGLTGANGKGVHIAIADEGLEQFAGEAGVMTILPDAMLNADIKVYKGVVTGHADFVSLQLDTSLLERTVRCEPTEAGLGFEIKVQDAPMTLERIDEVVDFAVRYSAALPPEDITSIRQRLQGGFVVGGRGELNARVQMVEMLSNLPPADKDPEELPGVYHELGINMFQLGQDRYERILRQRIEDDVDNLVFVVGWGSPLLEIEAGWSDDNLHVGPESWRAEADINDHGLVGMSQKFDVQKTTEIPESIQMVHAIDYSDGQLAVDLFDKQGAQSTYFKAKAGVLEV